MPDPDLHTDRPHPARVYDYLLGGSVNFPADRESARRGMRNNPDSLIPPRENRLFLRRAVRFLAARGVSQFLDIGTGIPSPPYVHHIAQEADPGARVLYVDNDPIVLAHSRELLTGGTEYLAADLRDGDTIRAAARRHLDLDRPVALLLVAILHFIGDEDDPHGIVRGLLAGLAPGSYLVLSHLTGDFRPDVWAHVTEVYRRQGVTMRVRPRTEIERFFTGLELVDPGLAIVSAWRPDDDPPAPTDAQVSVYGGVAKLAQ
ncbi:hypothetical protein L083_4774 [Actinoplanes sp. N902-109]|nr:hypothetical protein L083_4774 [Actinoplanes sp. N902-109]